MTCGEKARDELHKGSETIGDYDPDLGTLGEESSTAQSFSTTGEYIERLPNLHSSSSDRLGFAIWYLVISSLA